ncbi:hypothetical protein AAG906_012514 [Vitis piasezkii]
MTWQEVPNLRTSRGHPVDKVNKVSQKYPLLGRKAHKSRTPKATSLKSQGRRLQVKPPEPPQLRSPLGP